MQLTDRETFLIREKIEGTPKDCIKSIGRPSLLQKPRKNLSRWLAAAAQGEDVGIVCGAAAATFRFIFENRPTDLFVSFLGNHDEIKALLRKRQISLKMRLPISFAETRNLKKLTARLLGFGVRNSLGVRDSSESKREQVERQSFKGTTSNLKGRKLLPAIFAMPVEIKNQVSDEEKASAVLV